MRGTNAYQYALILLGVLATILFGVFLKREIFPEYRIYQNDYVALENFRSTYTHEPPPEFSYGVKQIVIERADKGPPTIDRCISCHVALEFSHFSPTKIAYDLNGNMERDAEGKPVQIPNEEYVWARLDAKIAALTDEKLKKQYKALKVAKVGEDIYDVTKVLRMHPLIGRETRPFEFHPIEQYGCVSCHSGNGRGLVTDRAHGPVFDGQYEIEYLGPTPKFTEADPKNDPPFARMFNDKPGDRLLFQTTPILMGGLIEAKCLNCHIETDPIKERLDTFTERKPKPEIDSQIPHYKLGEELYISQACYACHRIAGFARGGVGPELTREGNGYPWFLKESIVWPQADVPTSTMPNFRLDHVELEALMTFLLAQKGQPKSISETEYQAKIQQWEAGQRKSWEEPITPLEMHDVRFAMKVFATQGCAACHRLQGFDSNIGYAIEKGKPTFDQLYEEREWFKETIPEMIVGSELVRAIEKHGEEIDRRIVSDVRQGAILEEIEKEYPGMIEALYMPFRYASRAKMDSEKWQERLHRVLMMYIQEYGLGRLVGPRPNWSGIYRSDEWLMEHFHNPSAHVARSIMPVFPFDDSKFYALTHMLDVLAKKNRDRVREVWDQRGFSPEQAFQIHCSQCHGAYKQGNGPVAEWIYPIPKNLTNADFLRNLTKERAIFSITHGVKGTPMPPWGEAVEEKVHQPELTQSEIHQLVDWLFATIPGAEVIRGSQDVPKWHYSPHDVLRELYQEGNVLKPGVPVGLPPSGLNEGREGPRTAALETKQEDSVPEVFDVIPNPLGQPDPLLYYIKKQYYTEENLNQGKAFFEMNCAACHGADADGSGQRAAAMHDAKPRMLTNLDWIISRDDLRLLRSIKYGVAGTAMSPWGDLTSSLQRLQLVMFIRHLSEEQHLRETLSEALYKTYAHSATVVDQARIALYPALDKLNRSYTELQAQRHELYGKDKESVETYQKELEALSALRKEEATDQLLQALINEIQREKTLYQNLGQQIIAQQKSKESLQPLLEEIAANADRYTFQEGKLTGRFEEEKKLGAALAESFQKQINSLKQEQTLVLGQFPSVERSTELTRLGNEITALTKLRNETLSTMGEAARLRKKQQELLTEFQEKTK